jgi:ubiquinone/menaquinone biosynthesis C-methylase UbiE
MTTPYRARGQYVGDVARDYDRDRRRSFYDRWKWERERTTLAKMVESLDVEELVLDVPTGTGRLLDVLGQGERRVIGSDLSLAMLALARDRAEVLAVPLLRAEAEHLPFPDDRFELVVSVRFFQHLPPAAVGPILCELARVSTRGVVIQAPVVQAISPLVRLVADAARGRFGAAARRRRPPLRDRYFPTRRSVFEADLERWGLELAASRPVTWRGGQLRLMHVRSRSGRA